jgi:hypothetical protein
VVREMAADTAEDEEGNAMEEFCVEVGSLPCEMA